MEIKKMYAKTRPEASKKVNKQIRRQGLVPSVLYGSKGENVLLAIEEKSWNKLFDEHSSKNLVIDLVIDGKEDAPELIKVGEVQRHTLTERLLHVDLIRLRSDIKAEFEVPIEFVGKSEGQKEGGVLTQFIDTLKVLCYPRDVPDSIVIDMTPYKLGQKLHVGDLKWDYPNVEIISDKEQTIFSIDIPKVKTKAEETTEAAAEAEAAEGEEKEEEGEDKAEKEKSKK